MKIPYFKKNEIGEVADPRKGSSLIGDKQRGNRIEYAHSNLVNWAGINVYGEITIDQLLKMYNMNLSTMKSFYSLDKTGSEPLAYSDEAIKKIAEDINNFCATKAQQGFFPKDIYNSIQPALENVYTQQQSRLRVYMNSLIKEQQDQIVSLLKDKGFDTTTLADYTDLTRFQQPQDVSIDFPENAENLQETLKDALFAEKVLKPFYDKGAIFVSAIEVKKAQRQAEQASQESQAEALKAQEEAIRQLDALQVRYKTIESLTLDDLPALQKEYDNLMESKCIAESDADRIFDLNSTYYGRYSSDLENASERASVAEEKARQQEQIITDLKNKDILEKEIFETRKQLILAKSKPELSEEEVAAWKKYHTELEKYNSESAAAQDVTSFVGELEHSILPTLARACDQFENIKVKNQYPYYVFDQIEASQSFLKLPMFINENQDFQNPLKNVKLDQEELLKATKSGLPLGFVFNGTFQASNVVIPTEMAKDVQIMLEAGFVQTYQYNVDNPTHSIGETVLNQTKTSEELIKRLKGKRVSIEEYTPIENPLYPSHPIEEQAAWEIAKMSEAEFKSLTPLERAGLFPGDISNRVLDEIYAVEKPTKTKPAQGGQGDDGGNPSGL